MSNSASLSTYTTMMRVNSQGRPYAKDLYDIFSAFLIQQPLSDHRSMFRTYHSTFTTDEAVESLGQLEFTHLVSTPNPLDPSNPLLTRTTTTFSMSRAMAKTLGKHFLNARLAENATDPQNRTMKDRGIWSPTPKGKFMIQDFSHRSRVAIKHMHSSLVHIQQFQIVQFERLLDDDQISFSRPNMAEAFKVMMQWLPTESLMMDDIGGVNNDTVLEYQDTFYGYQCFEWISEYTSVVCKEEAEMIAAEFVQYGWILQVLDKSDRELSKKDHSVLFKTGRRTQYYLTDKGRHILDPRLHVTTPHHQPSLYAEARTRTPSSTTTTNTSSSDSSVRTNNSNGRSNNASCKLKREDYASRLLPTTAITSFVDSTSIIPKAIITKYKQTTHVHKAPSTNTEEVASLDNSILQLEGGACDFRFSSASSTASSAATAAGPQLTSDLGSSSYSLNNELVDDSKEEALPDSEVEELSIDEQMQHLDIAADARGDNHDSDSQLSEFIADQHQQYHLEHSQPNSQIAKLQRILKDPLIRMYFRQFLKSCFCEENINFWVDYNTLIKKIGYVATDDETPLSPESFQTSATLCNSLLMHCCAIYNNYFSPENAPNELNIDHGLRYDIVQYMQATFTSTVHSDGSSDEGVTENTATGPKEQQVMKPKQKHAVIADPSNVPFGSISVSSHGILSSTAISYTRRKRKGKEGRGTFINESMLLSIREGVKDSPQTCLFKIVHLYNQANTHICKIMAQDSVPRFIKTQKYQGLMNSYYHQSSKYKKDDDDKDEGDDF